MKQFEQSRRDFLRMAGKGVASAAVLTAVPSAFQPALAETEAPAWPWEYKKMDKQVALERGYASFYTHGGCCAGCVAGLLEPMAEEYGYPYNQINARMFASGAGGYGAQSLCGSLGGALAFIGLFCNGTDAGTIRSELYAWYKGHAFPEYQPDFPAPTQTIAESVNCVDSVGKYMAATGFTMADDGRKARCAAVTGEVAAKTVELLNIHFGFEVAAPAAEETVETASNEYIGTAKSEIGGEVKVKVTMDGDKIAKIDVLSHNETPGISDPAFNTIPDAIIAAQSTTVDTVTGATKTSEALIAAVNDALSQIKK